jgi:hypothetical protein
MGLDNFIDEIERYRILRILKLEQPQPEPDNPVKIKCPICQSTEYLVVGFGHSKVLVCDRPTCTYARAKARIKYRPRLVSKEVI